MRTKDNDLLTIRQQRGLIYFHCAAGNYDSAYIATKKCWKLKMGLLHKSKVN